MNDLRWESVAAVADFFIRSANEPSDRPQAYKLRDKTKWIVHRGRLRNTPAQFKPICIDTAASLFLTEMGTSPRGKGKHGGNAILLVVERARDYYPIRGSAGKSGIRGLIGNCIYGA